MADTQTLTEFTINYLTKTQFDNISEKEANELYLTPEEPTYLYVGTSSGSSNAQTSNDATYLILVDDETVTSRRKISGTSNVSVSSDANGNITITGPDLSTYVNRTYTSTTGKPTGNSTPTFGGTVTISQISQNTAGQISATDRTITIPGTIANYNTIGLVKPWYSHSVASTGPTAGSNTTAITVNAISTDTGKYYAIESDNNGRLFVNVPWTDHNDDTKVNVTLGTTTKAYLLGTSTTPTSSAQAVTAIADTGVYLDTTAGMLHATTFNGLTLTAATTGFTIKGGTTSKTLTVNESYTLGAASAKAVDTSISDTSSTNLPTSAAVIGYITGLGYTSNVGTVTKVTAGTGLAIGSTAQGSFTSSGTINHTNSVTAKTAAAQSAKTLTWGDTFTLYEEKYDAQGHITGVASYNMTMPDNPNTHQTIKQDGVTGATGNHFGVCSTGASTAAKTVSITSGDVTLETGLRVIVKFTYANTATTAPTLNVNSKGAKNIYHNGAQITTGANKSLLAGTVEFVYDGTQWQLVGNYLDTDTKAWSSITGKPTVTGSGSASISASTTATKTTLGTAFTIPNVTDVGSASTWVFEDIPCDDITAWNAGTASSWTFESKAVGTSISGAVVDNDTLEITLGTTNIQSKSGGSNGTAPTLTYTGKTASHVKSGGNGTAPTLGTAFTVPNVTGNTTGSVTATDSGHTHSISSN